jgi:hypothetical protein
MERAKNKSITSSFVFVTAVNTVGNHVSAVNCAQLKFSNSHIAQ